MSLIDLIKSDNDRILFSPEDLGEPLTVATSSGASIQCLGALESNLVDLTSNPGRGVPLQRVAYSLFLREADALSIGLRTGLAVYVNGQAFEVLDSSVELGVWQGQLRGGRPY